MLYLQAKITAILTTYITVSTIPHQKQELFYRCVVVVVVFSPLIVLPAVFRDSVRAQINHSRSSRKLRSQLMQFVNKSGPLKRYHMESDNTVEGNYL